MWTWKHQSLVDQLQIDEEQSLIKHCLKQPKNTTQYARILVVSGTKVISKIQNVTLFNKNM